MNKAATRRLRVIAALLAFTVPFIVYAVSSSPNPGFWDLGEMATVPYLFGIAHTTGFPLFVILGWIATHVVPFGTIAWRTTLVACAGGAAAAFALWFALDALEAPPLVSLGVAWWFAFGDIVWQRANRTDVHALEVGFAALALAFAIRFNRKGGDRWAMAAAFAAGCGLATHPNAIWLVPALIVLLWKRGLPYSKVLACALVPLLSYLYIPLRSAYLSAHRVDPTLALGVPPGQPFWNYANPDSLSGFWWLISGAQYRNETRGAFAGMLDPHQYLSGARMVGSFVTTDHHAAALVVALFGFIVLLMRTPRITCALAASALCWSSYAQGYSIIETDPARYLLAVFWMVSLCIGCLWFVFRDSGPTRLVVGVVAMVAGLSLLWSDWPRFLLARDPLAAPYIARVKRETGPRDVIVAQWTYVTPLGYAKYVEGTMGDRNVVNGGPPEGDALIAALAAKYRTDIVLEKAIPIPGVTLRPLDHAFPAVFRVEPSLHEGAARIP